MKLWHAGVKQEIKLQGLETVAMRRISRLESMPDTNMKGKINIEETILDRIKNKNLI